MRKKLLFEKQAILKLFVLVLLAWGASGQVWGQGTVNLPTSGAATAIPAGQSTLVYDNGGPTADYSANCSGYVYCTAMPGYTITISGSYYTEDYSASADPFKIFSGNGTGGTVRSNVRGSNPWFSYTGTAGEGLTIQLVSDGSVQYAGLKLLVTYSATPTLNVPTGGGNNSVSCGTTTKLFDHAGTGSYSANASGYTVLNSAGTAQIRLQGVYYTEANYDYIRIYAGSGTGGTLLATYHGATTNNNTSGQGIIIDYTGTAGQTLTVAFTSDGGVQYNGFEMVATWSGSCNCSGTPTGGTATVSPTSGNPNTAYTVSATGYTAGATGLTYQWQSNTNGAGWVNVGSATATYANYNATAPATVGNTTIQWRLLVTCTNSGQSATSTAPTFTVIAECPASLGDEPTLMTAVTPTMAVQQVGAGTGVGPGSHKIYSGFDACKTYNLYINTQGGPTNCVSGRWLSASDTPIGGWFSINYANGAPGTYTNSTPPTGATRLEIKTGRSSWAATSALLNYKYSADNSSVGPLVTTVSPVGNCGSGTVTLKVNDQVGKGGEINHSTWAVGSGTTTGYVINGAVAENERINSTDPWGNNAVIWEARSDGGNDASGGWNTPNFPIDNTKTYRFSVWVKRSIIGNGSAYLGTRGYNGGTNEGVYPVSGGGINNNPYFWSGTWGYQPDEWVLIVGFVFPHNHVGTTNHSDHGLYTLSGAKSTAGVDFKWTPTTTHAMHRAYLYYATQNSTRQQFAYPRVDVVDGSEPSIQQLLNGFDAGGRDGLAAGATWQWYSGSCGGTSAGTGSSITVTPSATTRYYVRAEGGTCAAINTACKEATVIINPKVNDPIVTPSGATTFCEGNNVQLTASDINHAGNAVSFAGTGGTANSGNYINVGNVPAMKITGDQTIEMWLRPNNFTGRQNPYNKAYGGEGTITQEPSGILNYYYGTSGVNGGSYQGFGSVGTLTAGQWNHVALVRDLTNGTLKWYINGVETNSAAATYPAAAAGDNPLFIGAGYAGGYDGQIDEVRVWNVARTPAEIANNMNIPIAPGTAGLAGYWKFDEASGDVVLDASGNSNTGTSASAGLGRVTPSTAPMQAAASTYTWSPATGLNTTSGKVVTATPGSSQTYTVSVANPLGCATGTKAQAITVDQKPVLPTLSIDHNVTAENCHGRTVTLTATGGSIPGVSRYVYGTASGGTQVSTATTSTTATHIPTATTTTYYVGVTANGACPAENIATPITYLLPAKGTVLAGNENATCYVSGTTPIHFYNRTSGNYIGSINPQGRTGVVTMTAIVNSDAAVQAACDLPANPKYHTAYMQREVHVDGSALSGVGNVDVVLAYSDAELSNLQTKAGDGVLGGSTPSNTADDITSLLTPSLGITKVNGATNAPCGVGNTVTYVSAGGGVLSVTPAISNARYVNFSVPNFSHFYIHGVNNSSPLPITLTSFSGNCDNGVQLAWTTATETNVNHYEIYRTRDGQAWEKVAEVNAVGNSSTANTYHATDASGIETMYYKLRSVDNDGTFEDFNPIAIKCDVKGQAWSLHPVPATTQATITIETDRAISDNIVVMDMNGRAVQTQAVNLEIGVNYIILDVQNFAKGTYMVKMNNETEYKPLKLMKID